MLAAPRPLTPPPPPSSPRAKDARRARGRLLTHTGGAASTSSTEFRIAKRNDWSRVIDVVRSGGGESGGDRPLPSAARSGGARRRIFIFLLF